MTTTYRGDLGGKVEEEEEEEAVDEQEIRPRQSVMDSHPWQWSLRLGDG